MSIAAFAGTDTWVVVRMKGGMTQAYLVPGRMIVKTEGDLLRLTSEKMEVAYEKKMVEGYFFQRDDDMPTDIEQVMQKGITVEQMGEGKVVIKGMATNAAVRVYGINGLEYKNCTSKGDDAVVVGLGELPPGVYIINIEGVGAVKVKH